METDERENNVDLNTMKRENRHLEREKKRAEYEIESWKKKFRKLQTEDLWIRQEGELERELEICRNKCNELWVELEEKKMECVGFEDKLKELMSNKISVENELDKYKMRYSGLKEQMTCLEEDRKDVCERENKARERITYLSEKMEIMENDDREKYADLKLEIRDLESAKRGAEDENEVLKKRSTELETEFLSLKHEIEVEKVEFEVCRTKCGELSVELETKKMDCGAIQDKFQALMLLKIAVDDELKECKTVCDGLKERIKRIEIDQNILCGREKRGQERIAQLLEELKQKEHDKSRIYVQFKNENRELECRRKSSEDEMEIWKKKCQELECQSTLSQKHENKLEKELEVCRNNCDGLSAKLQESKIKFVGLEGKLKDLKIKCSGLQEHICYLEEDKKIICERENIAQERITRLLEEIMNMERDERNKYEQLEAENWDLELEKRKAEAEIDDWKKRFKELETQAALRGKQKVELEKELDVDRTECDALSMKLKENKMECVTIETKLNEELNVYKITCNELKEQISHLEENQKVTCAREKMAQQRINNLYEELKNIETGERDKNVQLEAEKRNLELAKRRAEDEIDAWKKRFCELESRVLRVEEESSTLRCIESHVSGDMESDPRGVQAEVSHNDYRKEDRNKMTELQSEAYGGDNIAPLVHVTGAPSIDMQCVPSLNVEKKMGNSLLECNLESGYEFGKQLVLELEGSSNEVQFVLELGSTRPQSGGGIINIDDSSDSSSDKEKDLTLKNCLKRLYLDQKFGGSCNVDSPFTSTKRKQFLEIITCESDSEDDNEIEKLQELKHEVLEPSPVNMLSETPNASCGGHNIEEKKGWGERTSQNEHTSLNQLKMSGMSNEKVGNSTAKNGKEIMDEEFGSDSKDGSLGRIKLEGYDSSDSGYSSSDLEDSGHLHLAFDNVMKKVSNRYRT